MTNKEICIALAEISVYFYGCYCNAASGTKACKRFHRWMCAVDEASQLLSRSQELQEEVKQE